MPLVKPFYAPISSGSMAHTGPIPQSNVAYTTISSNPARGTIHAQPVAPIIRVGQGYYPTTHTPIQPPHIPVAGTPIFPVNWVHVQHS